MVVQVYVDDAGSREGRTLAPLLPQPDGHPWTQIIIEAVRGEEMPDAKGHYRDDQLVAKCHIPQDGHRVSFHHCKVHSLVIVKWFGDVREG